jgi:hypothetical protein
VTVVGCTGHQGLPTAASSFARDNINRLLRQVSPLTGLTSLAEGADQLFAESVLAIGGELRVIVPCRNYAGTFNGTGLANYQRLLDSASNVRILEFVEPSEEAFFAAGRAVVDDADWVIAIWDGEGARGMGGTADIVAYAKSIDRRVEIIWPEGVVRR